MGIAASQTTDNATVWSTIWANTTEHTKAPSNCSFVRKIHQLQKHWLQRSITPYATTRQIFHPSKWIYRHIPANEKHSSRLISSDFTFNDADSLVDWCLVVPWSSTTKFNTLRPRRNRRPLRRRHFQMHFMEWNCIDFGWDFTEINSQRSN